MIKKVFWGALILLCSNSYTRHQPHPMTIPNNSPFYKANELYKKGKFKKAMKLYEKIDNKGAAVYYNLGNCAYKLKQYGKAMLNWRRTEVFWGGFNRGELIDNIVLLREKIKTKMGFPPKKRGSFLRGIVKTKNYLVSWLRAAPLLFLQLMFLLLWIFVFVYLRFLYRKKKQFAIVTVFALIAFFGIMLIVRYSFEARTYGVVIKDTALRSGPSDTFQELQQLPAAQEIVIKKESGDYYKAVPTATIKALKRVGWIHKKDIEKI